MCVLRGALVSHAYFYIKKTVSKQKKVQIVIAEEGYVFFWILSTLEKRCGLARSAGQASYALKHVFLSIWTSQGWLFFCFNFQKVSGKLSRGDLSPIPILS